jgi:molybdopterin-synthase adenylyltransferase
MNNQRYLRNNLTEWFSQEAVQNKYIGIIGCGAVGNEVVKNLALLGVGRMDVYDFDKIEIHNLTRSVLFRETDIGKNKSDIVAERAMELDPNIHVSSFPGDFWDKITIDRLREYDVIISCVDNFEARLRINQLCVLFSKNFINTGIDSRHISVESYPIANINDSACYECNLPPDVYKNVQQRYSCGWLHKISFREKIIPTTTITGSIAGAIASSQALRIDGTITRSNRVFLDTITGSATTTILDKNPECPTCGQQEKFVIIKSVNKINSVIRNLKGIRDKEIVIHTSEPILTEYRCIKCNPRKTNATKVFKNARNFDASLTKCGKCGNDTVQIEIKDNFSISEVMRKYRGFDLPCKYITSTINHQKYLFDLEVKNESNY